MRWGMEASAQFTRIAEDEYDPPANEWLWQLRWQAEELAKADGLSEVTLWCVQKAVTILGAETDAINFP